MSIAKKNSRPRLNMSPSIWGEPSWLFIHSIALGYPDNPSSKDKMAYKIFFKRLGDVLPCDKCTVNYAKHSNSNRIEKYLKDSNHLFAWTVIMRNEVTKQLGKTNFIDPSVLKASLMRQNDDYESFFSGNAMINLKSIVEFFTGL